jgi:hypothetical protein
MKIEFLETALVSIIVLIQLIVFFRTFSKIQLFKRIIPKIDSLSVIKVEVPITDLESSSPREILSNIDSYLEPGKLGSIINATADDYEDADEVTPLPDFNKEIERTQVNVIQTNGKSNKVFDKIVFSINNYLIRNRGASSDFNLMKDIVERNTNAIEEDINLSIGIPLYLGLMGTMMGIVIALFNMPDLSVELGNDQTGQTLDEGIAMLIGGVKIAMIASFMGLMLTIINSGWVFKGSRSYSEASKNELYTFIQIELLPIINQGLASTLESLQRNLLQFNSEFSSNLKGLTGVFDSNRSAIREQKALLDALDKAKVSEMTKYNVAVLKQLDLSVGKFEKFNVYLSNTNQFVENSQQIITKSNELLSRTDNFQSIAENLENKLNQSQQLLSFLSEHFNKLEEHKQFTSNTVADVGHSISQTFEELQKQIQTSSESVKQFTIDETELLKNALSESKTNLANLEHLYDLKTDVSQFKNSSASQGERLKQTVEDLNSNMAQVIQILEQIEKKNSVIHSVKSLFKSKKKSV